MNKNKLGYLWIIPALVVFLGYTTQQIYGSVLSTNFDTYCTKKIYEKNLALNETYKQEIEKIQQQYPYDPKSTTSFDTYNKWIDELCQPAKDAKSYFEHSGYWDQLAILNLKNEDMKYMVWMGAGWFGFFVVGAFCGIWIGCVVSSVKYELNSKEEKKN